MSTPLPRIVHQGFDTIEVAFQGILPPSVRRVLSILKERARERGEAVLAQLGDGALECHVFATGLGTGNHNYTWRFKSALGLIWAWNDSDDIEAWNGRVKAGAEILLTFGVIITSATQTRRVVLRSDPANTVNIRIGDAAVGAAAGLLLQPGESLVLFTQKQIEGYAPAAGQKVSWLWEKVSP
jgi:hypothetical protein